MTQSVLLKTTSVYHYGLLSRFIKVWLCGIFVFAFITLPKIRGAIVARISVILISIAVMAVTIVVTVLC